MSHVWHRVRVRECCTWFSCTYVWAYTAYWTPFLEARVLHGRERTREPTCMLSMSIAVEPMLLMSIRTACILPSSIWYSNQGESLKLLGITKASVSNSDTKPQSEISVLCSFTRLSSPFIGKSFGYTIVIGRNSELYSYRSLSNYAPLKNYYVGNVA